MLSITIRACRHPTYTINTFRTRPRGCTFVTTRTRFKMGKNNKKKSNVPDEKHLLLPLHSTTATTPVIDTHTHLITTYSWYRSKFPTAQFGNIFEFVRGLYDGRNIKAIVDVWCEPPMPPMWKELADSAIAPEDRALKWGGMDYWFVMGEPLFISSRYR